MQVNYAPINSNDEAPPPSISNADNNSSNQRFSRRNLLLGAGAILTVAIMFISYQPAAQRSLLSSSSGISSRMPAPLTSFKEARSYSVLSSAGMGMIHPILLRHFGYGYGPSIAHTNVTRSIFSQHIMPPTPVRVGYAPYIPVNDVKVNPPMHEKIAPVSAAHITAEAARKRSLVLAQMQAQARFPAPQGQFVAHPMVQRMPVPPVQAHYLIHLKNNPQAALVSKASTANSLIDPTLKESMKLAAIPKPVV